MHRSVMAVAGVGAALLVPAAPAAAEEPAICHIAYQANGDTWSFNGKIVISNTGPVTLYGWTLRFSLPAGHTFGSGWEADFTVDGQDVTAYSLAYNSVVAPKKSVSVGFHASGSVKGPRPPEFRVNDHLCTAG
ncbi:cellulose binding domain-containing protein [Actinoplanes sp. GCM10030250]|uniref:cellulose binding domain-containing protein n=1 Tax=Actinoplanes sp. GCM10030250 TaxID=3273376 RepID=UPI003612312C